MHVALFSQGRDAHSLMSISQLYPWKPGTQKQWNSATPSTQIAPFWQGSDTHSSTFSAQVSPSNPGAQWHWKPSGCNWQVPLFLQGRSTQSVTRVLHWCPPYPSGHLQKYPLGRSTHRDRGAWQGSLSHSFTSSVQLSPVNPSGQTQEYRAVPGMLEQFSHGANEQASYSWSQFFPMYRTPSVAQMQA